MTIYDKSNLKTFFEQGDIPSGTDYANLIDSQVNIAETTEQSMAGNLKSPKFITPLVSATTGDFGTVNTTTLNTSVVSAPTINATTGTFTTVITTNVSATGTVYTSAMRSSIGNIGVPTIISAAGTTRATAALMTVSYMLRGQGVTDGTATGFALPVPVLGYVSFFVNDTAVSANLYPGGADYTINALASGAPFPLAARTGYTIMHYAASAYTVK
jgi:hypothetical protein